MKSAIKSITGGQDLLQLWAFLAWARFATLLKGEEKLAEAIKEKENQYDEAVAQARAAMAGDLVEAQAKVQQAKDEVDAMKKQRDEAQKIIEKTQLRLDDTDWTLLTRDREVTSITLELDQSRRKARDIGDELGKV